MRSKNILLYSTAFVFGIGCLIPQADAALFDKDPNKKSTTVQKKREKKEPKKKVPNQPQNSAVPAVQSVSSPSSKNQHVQFAVEEKNEPVHVAPQRKPNSPLPQDYIPTTEGEMIFLENSYTLPLNPNALQKGSPVFLTNQDLLNLFNAPRSTKGTTGLLGSKIATGDHYDYVTLENALFKARLLSKPLVGPTDPQRSYMTLNLEERLKQNQSLVGLLYQAEFRGGGTNMNDTNVDNGADKLVYVIGKYDPQSGFEPLFYPSEVKGQGARPHKIEVNAHAYFNKSNSSTSTEVQPLVAPVKASGLKSKLKKTNERTTDKN